jgi:site-specific DNA-methyltransferase (adenine-specific)
MSNRITKLEHITDAQLLPNTCYVQPFSVRTDAVSELYNMDCVEGMKHYPDKYFDLAIVDPPYGIGDKFKGGKTGKMNFNEIVNKDWDKVPPTEYFNELMRVSKNQIIWGGNYFNLPPTRCFIVWDKIISDDFSLAMAELAWTSFDKLAKIIKLQVPKDGKIHPTQKPLRLYEWILTKYAEKGQKILDTHVGSGSSRIACYQNGFDFVGFEIDLDYCQTSEKRFVNAISQQRLF